MLVATPILVMLRYAVQVPSTQHSSIIQPYLLPGRKNAFASINITLHAYLSMSASAAGNDSTFRGFCFESESDKTVLANPIADEENTPSQSAEQLTIRLAFTGNFSANCIKVTSQYAPAATGPKKTSRVSLIMLGAEKG